MVQPSSEASVAGGHSAAAAASQPARDPPGRGKEEVGPTAQRHESGGEGGTP